MAPFREADELTQAVVVVKGEVELKAKDRMKLEERLCCYTCRDVEARTEVPGIAPLSRAPFLITSTTSISPKAPDEAQDIAQYSPPRRFHPDLVLQPLFHTELQFDAKQYSTVLGSG